MAFRILFFLAQLSSSSMEPQSFLSGAVSGIGEDAVCHLYGNPVDFRCTRARGPLAGHSTVGRKLQPDLLGLEGRVPSLGYRVSLVPEGEHEDSHHNHG